MGQSAPSPESVAIASIITIAREIVEILKRSEDASNLDYSVDDTWGKYNPEKATDKSMLI